MNDELGEITSRATRSRSIARRNTRRNGCGRRSRIPARDRQVDGLSRARRAASGRRLARRFLADRTRARSTASSSRSSRSGCSRTCGVCRLSSGHSRTCRARVASTASCTPVSPIVVKAKRGCLPDGTSSSIASIASRRPVHHRGRAEGDVGAAEGPYLERLNRVLVPRKKGPIASLTDVRARRAPRPRTRSRVCRSRCRGTRSDRARWNGARARRSRRIARRGIACRASA